MGQGAETAAIFNKREEISQQLEQIRQEMFISIRDSFPFFQLFHDLKLRDTLNTKPDLSVLFPAIEEKSKQYPDPVQKIITDALNFLLHPDNRNEKSKVSVRSMIRLEDRQLIEITLGLEIPKYPLENNKIYLKINFPDQSIGWQFFNWDDQQFLIIPKNCPIEEQLAVADCLIQGTLAVIKPGI